MKHSNNSNAKLVKQLGILATEINMADLEIQRDVGDDELVAEKLARLFGLVREFRETANDWSLDHCIKIKIKKG